VQFRPTLIIGLGGSGTFVVRRLKKRLRRLVQGDVPPAVQLLAFDTDSQKADENLEELTPSEFHRLSNFPGNVYVTAAAKAQNPAIAQFWQYKNLVPDFIQDGAKQRPPVGRLALFVRFDDVVRQISDAVTRMFRSVPGYTPPPNIGSVDVYIIGSSCGGTGAGMFFDIANLSRHEIAKSNRETILQGHVFLPSCFAGTQVALRSIQTNACAFLRTMEVMQSDALPAIQYPGLKTLEYPAPLFRRVHLISSVDVTGIRAGEVQDVFENVALQLDLEITGASARDMRSAADNAPADFNNRPLGRLAVYSSYGAAMLSGSSLLGRLAVLPAFSSRVVQALLSTATVPIPDIISGSLANIENILASDDEALSLVKSFHEEATRLAETERPIEAARNLVRRIDQIADTLTLSSFSELASLGDEIRARAVSLVQKGDGGITSGLEYLSNAGDRLARLIQQIDAVQASPPESAESIVSRVQKWWQSTGNRKQILESEGYQFLKRQSLLRVRKAVGRKVRSTLSGLSNDIGQWSDYLNRFASTTQTFIENTERYSRDGTERYLRIAGTGSAPDEVPEVRKRFDATSAQLVISFFADAVGRKALFEVAETVMNGATIDVWSAKLRRAAEEYLTGALAESVTVGEGWPEKAARTIIECQPMVQFVADHRNLGQKPQLFAYARCWNSDVAVQRIRNERPDLNITVEPMAEPGSLEVTSMVLNFALHQIQEAALIEDAYRQFAGSQAEPVENRYAWRAPNQFWTKIRQLSLLPLSPREQALARVLALSSDGTEGPVAAVTANGYKIHGDALDIDPDASQYQKYVALNSKLLSSRESERLLQKWQDSGRDSARDFLEGLREKAGRRLEAAKGRADDDGGSSFISMLLEDLDAITHEISRLPV
jgi:hypothetical protein